MRIIIFILYYLIFNYTLKAQPTARYSVDAELKVEEKIIKINQKVIVNNSSVESLDTLFFNDWSNSYSDSDSQLAQKLAEEFDRSFYVSSKKSKGYTKIISVTQNNNLINWKRLENQNDIVYVVLKNTLKSSDSLLLNFQYSVTIPNKQFTGVGYKKDFINIRDFIIALSPYNNGEWIKQSNLNLNDNSLTKSNYRVKWTYPKNFHLLSSMNKLNSISKGNIKIAYYKGDYQRSPKFIFSKNNQIREFKSFENTISTDIFKHSEELAQFKIDRINDFLLDQLPSKENQKSYLLTSYEYNLRPLYGLNIFPEIISPFDRSFIEEIKFLKIFSSEYVRSHFNNLNFRTNHWLSEGLSIYLIMKYISKFYPNQKLIGKLSEMSFIRNYSLSNLPFNKIFTINSEIILRRYLHQKATTSKDLLIKFNERIATPYQVGVLFTYLENYIGAERFKYILNEIYSVENMDDLIFLVDKYSSINSSVNLIKYLDSKHTLDFKIVDIKQTRDKISVYTDQKSNEVLPYKVAVIKDNKVIDSKWVSGNSFSEFKFADADYIAINPLIELPEINKLNNWRSLDSKILNKPLSIKFFKDSEDPTKNQLLVNPNASYNLYDGPSFGGRFHNKTLQRRPFTFIIEPLYSTIEKTLVGSIITDFRIYNDHKSNYLTQLSFFGSSFHYASNSLYKIAVPSLKFYFRPSDLRSNLRHRLDFSWYSIQRESLSEINNTPNYSLGEIKYQFSNKGSVKYFTIEKSFEFAKDFKKLILEAQYRKLFKSGRLFSSRLFFGSFLNKSIANNYFNFNLNKPNDYLFEYAYFGRSETKGFFSQQFILNEGGFKSIIPNTSSNQWMLSSNLSLGIWKWIEGYIDMAIIKNQFQKQKSYYDYGLRLNFVPDYLELYFPIGSSEEYSLNKYDYFSKIRFVLSLNAKDISSFFTRTWF